MVLSSDIATTASELRDAVLGDGLESAFRVSEEPDVLSILIRSDFQ